MTKMLEVFEKVHSDKQTFHALLKNNKYRKRKQVTRNSREVKQILLICWFLNDDAINFQFSFKSPVRASQWPVKINSMLSLLKEYVDMKEAGKLKNCMQNWNTSDVWY